MENNVHVMHDIKKHEDGNYDSQVKSGKLLSHKSREMHGHFGGFRNRNMK
jgi:hypothetical protein